MQDGSAAGFKNFEMEAANTIRLSVDGQQYQGEMQIAYDQHFSEIAASVTLAGNSKKDVTAQLKPTTGVNPLFFQYTGKGAIDFYAFELIKLDQKKMC